MLDDYLDRLLANHGMPEKQTTVSRIIRALREMSLSVDDGAYLGSENDLIDRLAISRPTLRQAAKVAENEQFISVRRGINGGIFARRPTMRSVVQLPALWLRMHNATLSDMQMVSRTIIPLVAARAAQCADEALIAELRALRKTIALTSGAETSDVVMLANELKLTGLMAQMAANPVLLLFCDIAYAFGMHEREQRFYDVEERRETWQGLQLQLCDAMLMPDPEIAMLITNRRHQAIQTWITENLEAGRQ
ncbi:MAG: hypothetical protein ABW048_06830 [Sphingobium sp.]